MPAERPHPLDDGRLLLLHVPAMRELIGQLNQQLGRRNNALRAAGGLNKQRTPRGASQRAVVFAHPARPIRLSPGTPARRARASTESSATTQCAGHVWQLEVRAYSWE